MDGGIWYRARKCNGDKIFTVADMENPNTEKIKISEGRFNHYGQSFLYLGDSPVVCQDELHISNDSFYWMQNVKIKHLEHVIDLCDYDFERDDIPLYIKGLLYTGKISARVLHQSSWKPEYMIPRFIADLCRKTDIDGIIYKSAECSLPDSKCMVVFNPDDKKIEYDGNPYLCAFGYKDLHFRELPF